MSQSKKIIVYPEIRAGKVPSGGLFGDFCVVSISGRRRK
jgi:hypothetical protein